MRRRPGTGSLGLVLGAALIVGSAAGRFCQAEEPPPVVQRAQALLHAIGLEYEVSWKPPLWDRSLPDGPLVGTPKALFEVMLPARGLAYDMLGPEQLQLQPRRRPWFGPEEPSRHLPPGYAEHTRRMVFDSGTVRGVVQTLESDYGLPVLLDYRIDDRQKMRGPIRANSLGEALRQLERQEGWQWFVDGPLIVFLPSAEGQVLGLPNDGAQKWIYAGAPLEEVVAQLAGWFSVDFELAESLLLQTVSGTLQGATLGDVLNSLGALCECSYAVADRRVYLAPKAEMEPGRFSSGRRQVLLELELLEVPEKRWKGLEITPFLTQFPAPSAEAQESFLNKIRRTSSVRSFTKAPGWIESGTEAEVEFLLEGKTGRGARYIIRMLPFLSEGAWIQLRLTMDFQEASMPSLPEGVRRARLFEQPVHGDFLVQDRQLLLVQGAAWKRDKKSSVLLLAVRPTLGEPGAEEGRPVSSEGPRWHLPWEPQADEEGRPFGRHRSGLPSPTRKISGQASP